MNNGWVKLHRKINENEILTDQTGLQVLIWIMTNVNKDTGKMITGRYIGAMILKLKPTTFYQALKRLEKKYKIVTLRSDNKNTEITLLNWDKYQSKDESMTQVNDTKMTPNRHQNDTKMTHIQELRNKNKENTYTPLREYLTCFNRLFAKKYQPTPGRERKLRLRLRNYTLEQILEALTNLSHSPFHRGENDRGWSADPDFLIRSDEQIDKFLNTSAKLPGARPSLMLDKFFNHDN